MTDDKLRAALERMRRAYERGADRDDLVRLVDEALAASATDEGPPKYWEIGGKRYGVPDLGPAPGEMSDLGVAYVELQRRFIAFADEVAAALAARPAVPALDVETLAEAIHEASGTHSKTPTRMICDNPSWDGHRVFAARILARLSSEGHTDD